MIQKNFVLYFHINIYTLLKEGKEPTEETKPEENKPDVNKELEEENNKLKEEITKLKEGKESPEVVNEEIIKLKEEIKR